MTITTILFLIFIPLLSIILLTINLIFAPHNAYLEKNSAFECGFHSFLGQNRTQFSISFFIFALLFLLFDLEILLVYPYSVSAYNNDIYGLITMLIFFLVLTLGFAFELGKNALKIETRQIISVVKKILKAIIKKSSLRLFSLSLFIIIFIVTYFVCNVLVIILINMGIISLPFTLIEFCGPLYMNVEPLDT
jgi:NADH-ubiquinone oxidoreductase chain 3